MKQQEHRAAVTVASFLEAGRTELEMDLVTGTAGLRRRIPEAALNRPGLALSGFFEWFPHRRVQVVGMAEHSYLASLAEEERRTRLRTFFERKVPAIVICRHKRVFPEMAALSEEFRVPVLVSRMITKHFINAATIIMENLVAPRLTIQGTMVEIMGIGVLITGQAGVGKSETALSLVKRGHALVSDDITAIRRDSAGNIIAAPVNVTRYHMEIRGLGIIHVPSLFGVASVREEKKLDLVVELVRPGEESDAARGTTADDAPRTRELLGVSLPHAAFDVMPGRDLANLVETAALDQKLRRLGHDAEKELDQRLIDLMTGGHAGSE